MPKLPIRLGHDINPHHATEAIAAILEGADLKELRLAELQAATSCCILLHTVTCRCVLLHTEGAAPRRTAGAPVTLTATSP